MTKKMLMAVNIVTDLVFLLGCLAAYINPSHFWEMGFLGLGFPFMLALTLGFLIFWLLADARMSLISLVALGVGYHSIYVFFAFHGGHGEPFPRPTHSLTILSYNVHYFDPYNDTPDKTHLTRHRILDLIKRQHPDIACFQEFYTSESPKNFDFKQYISDSLGLPYRFFNSDYNTGYDNSHSGAIIFSKFPIFRTKKIPLIAHQAGESAIYADLLMGKDTIRVFTMHLQSIYLNKKDLAGIEKVKQEEDTGFKASRTIFGKLKRAFIKRGQQATTISREIARSPYPVIVCGDFNDTPNSFAYTTIKGGLQDAFLHQGFGIGPTYISISPTLRIDYIFVDRRFRVNNFLRIPKKLSDHYPIEANITLDSL
ncbi:MAG: endonuclease/exonuclease/phosphatase family protein [Chitinophagaceae bacterium]